MLSESNTLMPGRTLGAADWLEPRIAQAVATSNGSARVSLDAGNHVHPFPGHRPMS